MTEADRAFLATVAQILPVILLALVIEARVFRFTHGDALPSFATVRRELRQQLSAFDYWGWRSLAAFRRWAIGMVATLMIATVLAFTETAILIALAFNVALSDGAKIALIAVVTLGALATGVRPVFAQLILRNVELSKLEAEVESALNAEATRQADLVRPVRLHWWARTLKRRRRTR